MTTLRPVAHGTVMVVAALLPALCVVGETRASARADVAPAAAPAVSRNEPVDIETYVRRDVQANQFPASDQSAVTLDREAGGGIVAVWHSRRQEQGTYGVFARRFDAAGRPLTDEVHVNAFTRNMQTRPVVAIGGDGGVWFAWESFGQNGAAGAIIVRKFDPSLSSATREILVSTMNDGHQCEVSLAATTDGGAVAVWTSIRDGDVIGRLYGRRLGPDGTTVGDPVRIDTTESDRDGVSRVAITPGGFVVVWARANIRGVPTAIVGRRLDAQGRPVGQEFTVNDTDGLAHIEPALAVAKDGFFVVGWMTAIDGRYVIHTRIFDPMGRPTGEIRRITIGETGQLSGMDLAIRGDRRFVMCWSRLGSDRLETDIYAQFFDAEGSPVAGPMRASETVDEDQQVSAASGGKRVVYGDDGTVTIAWSGFGGQDHNGAYLTVIRPEGSDVASPTPTASAPGGVRYDPIDAAASPYIPPTYDPNDIGEDRGLALASEMSDALEYGFVGITSTGWRPPDPHLAVGPNHMVLITNGKIAFVNKAGVLSFRDQIEDNFGFWGEVGATNFVFDPEVIYDPHSGRFMAMANERTIPDGGGMSYLLLAVSDDGDPNGVWYKYRIDAGQYVTGAQGSIDSPNIGVDDQAVYLSADMFGVGYLILILNKTPLLTGQPVTPAPIFLAGIRPAYGLPIIHGDAPAYYLIEADLSFLGDHVTIHALTDPLGTPTIQSVEVPVAEYRRPELVPQQGTSTAIATFDARFWSCVYRNGSLWATHHVNRGNTKAVQRWYQFDLNGWPTNPEGVPDVTQWGEVDAGGARRTFFGSIAVDAFDNMGMVFAQSSSTEFISIGRTGRLATDPAGTTRSIVTVKSSTSAETEDNPPRWGDYSGIVVDPADDTTFWYHHEFRTINWRTWVGTFSYADTQAPTIESASPFDGYVDPRSESSDGSALNRGIDRLTMTFSEFVAGAGGVPLDDLAFSVSATGPVQPQVRGVNTAANPTIEILLRSPIPVQQFTTVEAFVEDLSGNVLFGSVTYGFLPGDVNQDGQVTPLDLILFRQYLGGTKVPGRGGLNLYLDINRDGAIVPQDLILYRQLLAGTGTATRSWAGQSLP